ncbi:hypothetical protein CPB85DRAFT_1257037 [Mucidula mucida]|nr:hypothetical protein CPB85DRAFT_1257037 [Mucidula mucida]
MDLLQKYLGKLKSVTHVHVICSSHSLAPNLSYNTCLTPTLLILVLRLPALHTLVVNNCLIDHHIIPDSLRSRSLRVLVLNASTSAQPQYYAPNVPLPSPLQYAPAVTAIEMWGTEYQSGSFTGLELCLFGVLQSIVRARRTTFTLVSREGSISCIALEPFKVEEIVFKKLVTSDAVHTAFLALSVAGCGVLKRLSFKLGCQTMAIDTVFLCKALQRLSKLEEVTLECDAPPNDMDILDLAPCIAGRAHQLTPVNVMVQIHGDHTVEMKVYEEPRWLQFGGDDTKWWKECWF